MKTRKLMLGSAVASLLLSLSVAAVVLLYLVPLSLMLIERFGVLADLLGVLK